MTTINNMQNAYFELTTRTIYEAMQQLGLPIDEPDKLISRLKRLDFGLPAEDEFAAIVNWIGKCELIHKLDQAQVPLESKNYYRVPDFIAFFRYKESIVPVLIEVKTTKTKRLSWKPEFYNGLVRYAKKLRLPLLIAWKYKPFNIWTLFECKHLAKRLKNFSMDFGPAMKQTLMSQLVGDFSVVFKPNIGLHFVLRKNYRISTSTDETKAELWQMTIEDAYFTASDGARITELGTGLWALLLCAPLEENTDQIDNARVRLSFTIAEKMQGEWAHRMLPTLVRLNLNKEHDINWRHVLYGRNLPIKFDLLKEAIFNDATKGIIEYTLEAQPHTKPAFLHDD